MQRITPFLWFDSQAEEAANYYVSIFSALHESGAGENKSRVVSISGYSEAGAKASGRQKGTVMTVAFQLAGQEFVAINGGPHFKFTEAISFVVNCNSQKEVDELWEQLSKGGDEKAQQCGWLKDKYGLSWQIIPIRAIEMLQDKDAGKSQRVMQAILQMKKIDINGLELAYKNDT